jgi:tRNA(adenine34) deaminase
MQLALDQAHIAASKGEVPVGAVVVASDGRTALAAAHNQCHTTNNPTAHAEMLAIQAAAARLEAWRLLGCTLYVTLEPCPMCKYCYM